MTGTQLLDATIGVIFVVLSFSLVASALAEALATILNWRGRMLRRGLFRLLEGKNELVDLAFLGRRRLAGARLTQEVLGDPSLRVLFGPRSAVAQIWDKIVNWRRSPQERMAAGLGRLPSAIPSESFARALIDQLVRRIDLGTVAAERPVDLEALRVLIDRLRSAAVTAGNELASDVPLAPALRAKVIEVVGLVAVARDLRARLSGSEGVQADLSAELDGVIRQADSRLHGVLSDLGHWFDQSMERVSGWYQRRTRLVLFLLGTGLAAAVNVNLIDLGARVLEDPSLRAALVERADATYTTSAPAPEQAPLPAGRPGREADPVGAVGADFTAARDILTNLPGYGGAGLGWSCVQGQRTLDCIWQSLRFKSFLSWLLIGLGCMMGGQFWFDVLGAVLRFRPVANAARKAG